MHETQSSIRKPNRVFLFSHKLLEVNIYVKIIYNTDFYIYGRVFKSSYRKLVSLKF